MSANFETAGMLLVEYLLLQGDAAMNKKPYKWFSELAGGSYKAMLEKFDPKSASDEAANLYKQMKQPGNTGVTTEEFCRIRQQMLMLATATQALRFRYASRTAAARRTAVDADRFAKEAAIAAAGTVFYVVQDLKDQAQG